MQRRMAARSLAITLVLAIGLLTTGILSVAADTAGATLKTDDGEYFVGNGFGPGEVVSIYVTFPDGRVFAPVNQNKNAVSPRCCPQDDEVLADGTGSFTFELLFDQNQNYPTTTGSATDGVQFTNTIFLLPSEFAVGNVPNGNYTATAVGRVSLQKATAPFTIYPAGPPDFLGGSITSTGTLFAYTTIGHKNAARQVDTLFAANCPTTVANGCGANGSIAENPNVDVACNGLIPGERVDFWDTYPDGSVVGLSSLTADDGGTALLQLDLLTGKFPTGLHTFTCRGNTSNYYLTGGFLLLPGGIGAQSALGTLTISYVGANQAVANPAFPQLPSFFASDYLLVTARNFRPNETVTFWQTFPDQSSHFLATVKSDAAGVAVLVIQLFPGPISYANGKAVLGDAAIYQIAYPAGVDGRIPTGRHYFTAGGDNSGRRASAPFDLLPSQVDP
jgi:hypothetical protein